MNYPNGKKFIPRETKENRRLVSKDNCRNRGMALEEDINSSSNFYVNEKRALIYKRPTPIKVVRMDKVNKAKISEAYFNEKSTTDYNGVYKGRYLDFEAKETINRTSFAFANIRSQQVDHLEGVIENGGIAFFIIRMKAYNETYLLDASYIISKYRNGERKSITYDELKTNGHLINEGFAPRLDYLSVVEEVYFKN